MVLLNFVEVVVVVALFQAVVVAVVALFEAVVVAVLVVLFLQVVVGWAMVCQMR